MPAEIELILSLDEITEAQLEKLLAQNTPEKNQQVKAQIKAGILSGRLKVSRWERGPILPRNTRDFEGFHLPERAPSQYYFEPLLVIEWAINKKIELLPEIIEWHEQRIKPTPEANPPPYLDTSHPLHSPELAIAIEAWTAVLQPIPGKPKTGSRKDLVKDWLKSHHPEVLKNTTKTDRILIMLNTDTGAPKTGMEDESLPKLPKTK